MHLPHYFTLLRIFLSPLFPLFYFKYEALGIPLTSVPYILLALLMICESSDIFDGFLARKRNQVTDLGKVLDPMADSITHITLFLTFTQGIVGLPLAFVFILLYRDFFVSTLRTLCALRGVALGARLSGKLKTVAQAIASFLILLLMIPYTTGLLSLELFQRISIISVGIAACYTLFSMGDYVFANRGHLKACLQVK